MSPIERVGAPDHQRGTAPAHAVAGRLADKTALVTGAGSGIGRATAMRLAAEGASVGCLDIAADRAEAAAEQINAELSGDGGRALGRHCDVTDEASVAEGYREVTEALGPVQIICNIAGVGSFTRSEDLTVAEWNRVLGINLTGTFVVSKTALPALLEHRGVIVNTSSTAGLMGQPYSAAYCASKGGVSLLTKAMAVEFADRGVRVNAVAPGGVDTPIIWDFGYPEGANPKLLERLMSPMGFATPAEVAGAFAYLASDEAAYITGAILSVDGAITA